MITASIELTELQRLCFDCPVPFGCNEKDPRCLYRLALGASGRREDKYHILAFLAENGEIPSRTVAERFSWSAHETFWLLDSLNKAGFVERIEEIVLKWRLR